MASKTITSSSSRSSVCAVIVTYNPGQELARNVRAISEQVALVIVVDNGSSAIGMQHVTDASTISNTKLLLLGRNRGIAKALNVGISLARDQGFDWVVTLDHDSMPEPDMVEGMLTTLPITNNERIALVGPTLLDIEARTQLQKTVDSVTDNTTLPLTLMTSGCLTSVRCWKEVGGFREDMFIDYVDHEYCLRCTSLGWRIFQSTAILNHKLGAMRTHRLVGSIVYNSSHHSPRRRYYITRNRLLVWQTYWMKYPIWVLNDARACIIEIIKIILSEQFKLRKIAAIGLGIFDALFRRDGERNYKILF